MSSPGPVLSQLLLAFDDVWSHSWESVSYALADLTEEEASWRSDAYDDAPSYPGLPPSGTILWQIAHMENCARHYSAILDERPVENEPATPPTPCTDLPSLLDALQGAHGALRERIAALSENDLGSPCREQMTVAEFIRMVTRHDTWHAAQIVLLRRLYRAGSSRTRFV